MTARDRTVVIVIVVLAALAAAWLLVVSPVRDHASKLGAQISTAQSQLATARSQIAAGEAARATFATNYTTMARLGEAVPADDDVASLIVQVQAAANDARVDFGGLTLVPGSSGAVIAAPSTGALPPGASQGTAGLPIEPFTFTFTGNFFHLSDFFGRLKHFVRARNQRIAVSGRLMTLNAISLGAGPAGFPQITATVSATTYLLPAPRACGPPQAPLDPPRPQPVASGGTTTPLAPAAIGAAR